MSAAQRDGKATLSWRAEQLGDALARGADRLDPALVERALQLLDRVQERIARGEHRTVVALAGATGSGKSSLFNTLVADEVAAVDVRRPTTEQPTAGIWGSEPAEDLLDWLQIQRRHHVAGAQAMREDLAGLVLIDLPDVDSRAGEHRERAEQVLDRADVLLWVTDPQKYADARLHDGYLSRLRDHEGVMIAVLNQTDRLPPDAVDDVSADLAALISADGSGEVRVLTSSTRMGQGADELRDAIGSIASTRQAATDRLVGDLRGISRELLDGLADTEDAAAGQDRELIEGLKRAAGVPVILDAVQRYQHDQALAKGGWPLTRWARGLRPDPLRRLRLGDDRAGSAGIAPSDVRTVLGRSSLPPATPAARSAVDLATRRLEERAAAGLPSRWADAVRNAARPEQDDLTDALDQAVLGVPLRERAPWWWSIVGVLQLALVAAAAVGLVWTVLAAIGGGLYDPSIPRVLGVLLPLLLLVGGLVGGFLLGLLVRVAARSSGLRRRRRAERRLEEAITEVAIEQIRGPIARVLEDHARTRDQLRAAGR